MTPETMVTENIRIIGNQVWLKVGDQSFPIGLYWDSLDEAKWYAEQLKVAISKLAIKA